MSAFGRKPLILPPPARISLTNPQNTIYQAGWTPGNRFRTAVCGRRFGKTFEIAEELRRAVSRAAAYNVSLDDEIWYGAPNFAQGKRVMWSRLKRAIPRNWCASVNETSCSIVTRTGHVVRIVGLDTFDNLRGSGLYFFAGDEWADVKPQAWTEGIYPMLSTSKGHAMFVGTPKGFNNFYEFYNRGLSNEPADREWSSFFFTTLDGGNVDQEEIDEAARNLDARSYRQEYEASFESYAGNVLYAFNRRMHVKPTAECGYNPKLPLHIGMDFNVNPMSATVWQEIDKVSYQVDEIIIPTSNTHEMVDEILQRYPEQDARTNITVYPDAAGEQRRTSAQGTTDIKILRQFFRVKALDSNPLVRDRYNITNGRFLSKSGEVKAYVSAKCKKSIEAYEKLIYKDGTNQPDKSSGYDHPVDATGYYLFARFGGTYNLDNV